METVTREDLADEYKAELTDNYGYISLGYRTFTAGQVLEKCDPQFFNAGLNSYALNRGVTIVD